MRPLCSRTSCSKSKGGALAWLFIAARASAGRCSTRLQRLNDRSWPKCHFGPMARDLCLTGRDRPAAVGCDRQLRSRQMEAAAAR